MVKKGTTIGYVLERVIYPIKAEPSVLGWWILTGFYCRLVRMSALLKFFMNGMDLCYQEQKTDSVHHMYNPFYVNL
jgi:hypothetical protein